MNIATWSQLGIAGLIAVSLGGVIAYVFRLLISTHQDELHRAITAEGDEHREVLRLRDQMDEQQRVVLTTLGDVARVMAEVQQMLRTREIQLAMERGFHRREQDHGV